MFTILIFLVVITALDWFLLFSKVRPRLLVTGHGVMALLIAGVISLKSEFDLGPHIEIPGWIAGLIIAGLSFIAALVAIGAWRVFVGMEKK